MDVEKLLYLLLGWVLGLISPLIVDALKASRRKQEVAEAVRIELEELRYRMAATSLMMITKQGQLDKKFVNWVLPIIQNYGGNEPTDAILKSVSGMATLEEGQIAQLAQHFQSKDGVGLSLKSQQANFLESHLPEIARMPISLQRKIHEFRNQLHQLNQEIPKVDTLMMMTFNSGLSPQNYELVKEEIANKSAFVQEKCRLVADKITAILLEL